MKKYKAWDAAIESHSVVDDRWIEEVSSPLEAAIYYAQDDIQGLSDGIYTDKTHPIGVLDCESGESYIFEVRCEFMPLFSAARKTERKLIEPK